MKTEEQKSAFILRVEEMVKEIETLMQEGGGNERSCILLVNEKPQDCERTAFKTSTTVTAINAITATATRIWTL